MTLPYRYTVTLRRQSTATLGAKGQRTRAPFTTVATALPADLHELSGTIRLDEQGRVLTGAWGFFVAAGTAILPDDYLVITAGPEPHPAQLHVLSATAEGTAAEGYWDIHGTAELSAEPLD